MGLYSGGRITGCAYDRHYTVVWVQFFFSVSSLNKSALLLIPLALLYQDMRAEAEQQVYERLNMKIEEFLQLGIV